MARALLRSKPLCLLDEATSAVDAKSERDITLRLIAASRQKGLNLIAVTHRLQWLEAFDEVWFVERGAILWRGHHLELLKQADTSRYREFCKTHMGS
jgi:ABC-type multidrug transport system fused ATPase/permease subunit